VRIVLARARRELPTGTTLERAREAPAGRTQATEVERKSAAVVFAGLEPGAPRASIGGYPTHIQHDIRFILHPKLVIDCSVVTSFALLVWRVENKSATASASWQATT